MKRKRKTNTGICLTKKGSRDGLTPSLRFKILARDHFACQYCGRKAPDVELQIDHIVPIAKGGKTESKNLVAACKKCNEGKNSRMLLWDAPVLKEAEELEKYRKKRTTQLFEIFDEETKVIRIKRNEAAVNLLKNCIKKYGFNKTKEATFTARKHIIWGNFEHKGKIENRPDYTSIIKSFLEIEKICQEG